MRHLQVLGAVLLLTLAGCATGAPSASRAPTSPPAASPPAASLPAASPSPVATPVATPEVLCDATQFQPAPSLTCRPAIAVALAALAPTHPPIVREEFRYGGLCPPDAPCAPPLGDAGIVIFDFAGAPPVFVYVNAGAGGVDAASPPAPYPSGY
jgi:hypothetical protein